MRTTTNIFGYRFICDASYEELAADVLQDVAQARVSIANFVTPNAHVINVYAKYPELNRFCQGSRYILADGQPIVWLSRFTPHRIKKRLTGSDFFPVMFSRLKSPEHRCLFVIGNEGLRRAFGQEKPDAECIVPVFFDIHETEKINEITDRIRDVVMEKSINYVFIGISDPKQGALVQQATQKLLDSGFQGPCVFFSLGASYEFYFGLKKRAPDFFRNSGLEWFYRLMLEPKRMFKRYVIGNFIFILRAMKWVLTQGQKRP